jgi:hypothetical protein
MFINNNLTISAKPMVIITRKGPFRLNDGKPTNIPKRLATTPAAIIPNHGETPIFVESNAAV